MNVKEDSQKIVSTKRESKKTDSGDESRDIGNRAKPWTKKYEPKTYQDVVGQESVIEQLKTFILKYTTQTKKGLLLYGNSGTGKTSCVYAVGNENNLEILEVNASDFRNKDKILRTVGGAVKQMSLFAKGKLILLDEIDGLSGNSDRGGVSAIISVIKESRYPIVMTANDPFDKKFKELRKISQIVQVNTPTHIAITKLLKKISSAEKIKVEDSVLKSLSRRCGGDIRAAINDFQSVAADGTVTQEMVDNLSGREIRESLDNSLMRIFKTTDPFIAKRALADNYEPWDKFMLWIDENLPNEYLKPKDLARAYEALSRADVYSGRIRKRQHYRFLVYINDLLSAGIATSKDEKYKGMTKFNRPSRILSMYIAKMRFAKRNSIAEKLASAIHTSKKVAIHQIPYLGRIVKSEKMGKSIIDELELSRDEVNWLKTH